MKTKDESGFTLIETTIMLLVISFMMLIPIISVDKMTEKVQIDSFFRELSSNITMMQTHTVLNGETTEVKFIKSTGINYIDFKVFGQPNHPLNRRMIVDSPYYAFESLKIQEFHFKRETGNISASDIVRFKTTDGDYNLVYWLGSGRFEIRR